MITDIDRLHNVVDGNKLGRGVGKTFAKCHEIAGLIDLGFKEIFCIIKCYRDTHHILPMLSDVLYEYKMPNLIKVYNLKFDIGDVRIHFVDMETIYQDPHYDLGYDNFAVVDMVDY